MGSQPANRCVYVLPGIDAAGYGGIRVGTGVAGRDGAMTAERTRLPAEFSSFVGRAGEVVDLAEVVRTARAVTLCGAGGIGKTRLVLRLLAAIADDVP